MNEKSYSYNNIKELVDILLSADKATIKSHFTVAQLYIRVGLGKDALSHLKSVKQSILSNELDSNKLDSSEKDIKKLNIAMDLCRTAIKNNSKTAIVANKMYEDYCL